MASEVRKVKTVELGPDLSHGFRVVATGQDVTLIVTTETAETARAVVWNLNRRYGSQIDDVQIVGF